MVSARTNRWSWIALIGAVLFALGACSPSSDDSSSNDSGGNGDEGDEESILTGEWSGEWNKDADGLKLPPLSNAIHGSSGTITAMFEESDGEVTGDIEFDPDICDQNPDDRQSSNGEIEDGTLDGTDLSFSYNSPEPLSPAPEDEAELLFEATVDDHVIEGTYETETCHADPWFGTFVLERQ